MKIVSQIGALLSARGFAGGAFLPEEKETTAETSSRPLDYNGRFHLPMDMHLGPPATACVEVGQKVRRGQVVGRGDPAKEGTAFGGCPVHSPVSGWIAEVHDAHPDTGRERIVSIEPNGKDDAAPPLIDPERGAALNPNDLIGLIGRAGIVGMGGRLWPTHLRLAKARDAKVHTVIADGMESEPFLTSDHRLLVESGREILEALDTVVRTVGAKRGVLAASRGFADQYRDLVRAAGGGLTVTLLENKYPQGASYLLIRSLFGRQIPSTRDPIDAGFLVLSPATLYAIQRAVTKGEPLMQRLITVSGPLASSADRGNWRVRFGTPLEALVRDHDETDESIEYIIGGPMRGLRIRRLGGVVSKRVTGLVLLPRVSRRHPQPCIHCGWCSADCPMGLNPGHLSLLSERDLPDQAHAHGVDYCIECGLCNYICPSGLPIVYHIRRLKRRGLTRKEALEAMTHHAGSD